MNLTLKWTRDGRFLGGWNSKAKSYFPKAIQADGMLTKEIAGVSTELEPDGTVVVCVEVDHQDRKDQICVLEKEASDLSFKIGGLIQEKVAATQRMDELAGELEEAERHMEKIRSIAQDNNKSAIDIVIELQSIV